jgi:hypothetical protein
MHTLHVLDIPITLYGFRECCLLLCTLIMHGKIVDMGGGGSS